MEDLREKYEVVIGLEVHAQLKTKSKIFAPDSTEFGNEQNSQTSAITLGMPGVLPVLNKECVNMGILLGLALNCEIPARCKFDRKQYFYPDLPKGYQISQYDEPICLNGYLDIKGKRIGITRAHLEEDAGKLVHAGASGIAGSAYSLVDLNRAGTPLLEIVSEPDMRSSDEARAYMEELRTILHALNDFAKIDRQYTYRLLVCPENIIYLDTVFTQNEIESLGISVYIMTLELATIGLIFCTVALGRIGDKQPFVNQVIS